MSSNNFFEKTVTRKAKSQRDLTAAIPDGQRHLQNRNQIVSVVNTISPLGGTSGSQTVQFRLLQTRVSIDRCILYAQINNAGGLANGNPYLSIDQLRLLTSNGNDLICQLTGKDLFNNLIMLTESEFANASAYNNTSTTWGLGSGFGATSTTDLYLPLLGMPWDGNERFPLMFSSDLILELRLKDSASFVEAGTPADITFSQMKLYLDSMEYSPSVELSLSNSIKNGTYKFAYTDSLVYKNAITMAGSNTYEFTLSSVNGLVALLFISVYSATTGAGNRVPTGMQSYAILDSDGSNICGGSVIPTEYNKIEILDHFSHTSFGRNVDTIIHSFCSSPDRTMIENVPTGAFPFDGFQRLQLTTPAGLAGGTYTVEVSARVYSVIQSDRTGNLVRNMS